MCSIETRILLLLIDSTCSSQIDTVLSWLTDDADWQRLNLLTESRFTSSETQTRIWKWLKKWQHPTPFVHCLQRVQYRRQLLMHLPWQHHSHHLKMTLCRRNAPNEISKKLPNQDSINILMPDIDGFLLHFQNYLWWVRKVCSVLHYKWTQAITS